LPRWACYNEPIQESKELFLLNSRDKWNLKYQQKIDQDVEPKPNDRLMSVSSYLQGGLALDVACGLGGNSLYLAKKGYQVHAYDIADKAINFLKIQAEKDQLPIIAHLSDLSKGEGLEKADGPFELIVMTYYLERSLFPLLKSLVKKNGYFFMETYYMSLTAPDEGISERFKLKSQELLKEFAGWEILYYEEHVQESRQTLFCRNSEV
jgi:tellurite methyltransferase